VGGSLWWVTESAGGRDGFGELMDALGRCDAVQYFGLT
jgi:hypothetical protein